MAQGPRGADSPSFTHGLGSMAARAGSSAPLPEGALEKMREKQIFYNDQIEALEGEGKITPMQAIALRVQAERVARQNALIASAYERMLSEAAYRKKMQDPFSLQTIAQTEAAVEKFEKRLFQLMGIDDEYNAKVEALKAKRGPQSFVINFGEDSGLDKSGMAAVVVPPAAEISETGEDGAEDE